MSHVRILVLFFAAVCFPSLLSAQIPLSLDLARDELTGLAFTLEEPTDIQVTLLHTLPRYNYRVETRRVKQVLPPFSSGPFAKGKLLYDDSSNLELGIEICRDPRQSVGDALVDVTLESAIEGEIKKLLDDLASIIASLTEAEKAEPEAIVLTGCAEKIQEATRLLTTRAAGTYHIDRGEDLVITIARLERDIPTKEWSITIPGPRRGEWSTTYGFSFLPDRDERYFTKAKEGAADKFTITRERDRRELSYAPTVILSWMPASESRIRQNLNFFAGLGFDFSNPLVLGGISHVIGDNVSVFLGGAFQKRNRLKGQYNTGEEIGTALQSDQLVDSSYHINVVAGVGFRFDQNPFANTSKKEKEEKKKKEEQPKEAKGEKKENKEI